MEEKAAIKKLPNSQAEFDVTISWKDMERFIEKAARNYSEGHPIAGFRPGKAPVNVVEKKVGASALLQEAIELAVKDYYVRFVVDHKIPVVGSPSITLKPAEEKSDITFTAVVSLFPEIKLHDPKAIKVEKPKKEDLAVSEKEIEAAIKKLQRMRSKIITVNRPAKKGDRVEVDFTLFFDHVPFEGGSGKQYPVTIGEGQMLPAFEEQLVGMERGGTKRFELTFPADYYNKDIRNKKGEFEVAMKLVSAVELPEINDEFARNIGKFTDTAELKDSIRKGIEAEKKASTENKILEKFFGELAEKSKVDIPEILIKDEQEKMYHELEHNVAGIGLPMEEYLRQVKKTKEELMKGWHRDAIKRISVALAIREIAKLEKFDVIDEKLLENKIKELEGQMKNEPGSHHHGPSHDEIRSYARNLLMNESTINWIKKELLSI